MLGEDNTMALLNDEGPSSFEDWVGYDSKLLFLSEQENTSIEIKSEYAKQLIESELLLFLVNNTSVAPQQAQSLLNKVVVSEPLKRWHAMQTLFLYYDDIASVQASKSHFERSLLYSARAGAARTLLFETGIGLVSKAIPQPALPQLNRTPSNAPAFSLRGKTQYLDAEGNVGSPSKEFWIRSEVGDSINISYSELPEGVVGWNLYIEDGNDQFRSINPFVLGFGEAFQISSSDSPLGHYMKDAGQPPDQFIRMNRLLRA
jgi:hypothetical protein